MERTSFTANWLTRNPAPSAGRLTLALSAAVAALGLLSLDDGGTFYAAARATPAAIAAGEYWRAWTTLFVHGDLGHLASNLFLFIPLLHLHLAYFGGFAAAGIVAGGLVNLAVLKTMPADTALVGISGVVYWMGAAWLTLFLLLDRRERLKRRFGSALFLALLLFVPETLRPEVSHLSHFLGAVAGVISACALFALRKREFRAAEIREEAAVPSGEDGYREKYLWEFDREWEARPADTCRACG